MSNLRAEDVEPGARELRRFVKYSASKSRSADVFLEVLDEAGHWIALSFGSKELIAIIDDALREAESVESLLYRVDNRFYGIPIDGKVKNTIVPDGTSVTRFVFNRTSTGVYSVKLISDCGNIYTSYPASLAGASVVIDSVLSNDKCVLRVELTASGETVWNIERQIQIQS